MDDYIYALVGEKCSLCILGFMPDLFPIQKSVKVMTRVNDRTLVASTEKQQTRVRVGPFYQTGCRQNEHCVAQIIDAAKNNSMDTGLLQHHSSAPARLQPQGKILKRFRRAEKPDVGHKNKYYDNVFALLLKERRISPELVEKRSPWRLTDFLAYAGDEIPTIDDGVRNTRVIGTV